jgi:hypothetical protein
MRKESELLTSSPFENQPDPSLEEKQQNTGNLTSGGTRTEKSTSQNPSKPSIQ